MFTKNLYLIDFMLCRLLFRRHSISGILIFLVSFFSHLFPNWAALNALQRINFSMRIDTKDSRNAFVFVLTKHVYCTMDTTGYSLYLTRNKWWIKWVKARAKSWAITKEIIFNQVNEKCSWYSYEWAWAHRHWTECDKTNMLTTCT